jgi:O-antigen/teichoic acid export membrane protein
LLEELKTFFKHSSVYGLAAFLKKGTGFIMIPIYTRYLLPADYGLVELLDLTLNVVEMLVGFRIGAAIIRYYHHFDDPTDRGEVFTTALIFAAIVSFLSLAALEVFSHPISKLVAGSGQHAKYFQIIFVCLAIQTIYLVSETYLLAQKKSILYSSLSTGNLIVALSLNILLLVVFKMGVWAIVLSMLITKSLNGIVAVAITLKGVRLAFSWQKLKMMIKYSMPLIPAAFSLFLMHFSDRFFVQRYCDLNELGVYSLGYKFGMVLSVLVSAPIFRIWNTQRFEIAKQANAKMVFKRMFTYYSTIIVFAGLGLTVFIDDAIRLLASSPYHGASAVVPLIVLSYILYGMANFFGLGIMITYKTKYIAYIQMTVAGLNILFNVLFISRLGIIGAAFSTFLTFLCLAGFTLLFSQKAYFVPFEYGRVLILLALSGGIFAVSHWMDLPFVFSIGIKGLLMALFPVALFIVKFFHEEEIVEGRQLFRDVASRFGVIKAESF